MRIKAQVIQDVEAIYRWIDNEVARMNGTCRMCGKCCDFEAFGHRLYVTTPALLYFQQGAGQTIKNMSNGVCPYRINGKCSMYLYRFSGCRIFCCCGDSEAQNQLSEQAIQRFKALCQTYQIPYRYVDLKTGLNMLLNGVSELLPPNEPMK